MKKSRKWGIWGVLVAAIFLTSCGGKQEAVVTEMGVDGYVYVPRKVNLGELEYVSDLRVMGEYLYYSGSDRGLCEMKRLPLEKADEAAERFGLVEEGELVFAFSTSELELPGTAEETGEDVYLEMFDKAREEKRLYPSTQQYTYVDPAKEYCRFLLSNYALDQNGSVAYAVRIYAGNYFQMEEAGSLICGLTPEGETAYLLYQPVCGDVSLAMDGKGRLLLAAEDGIRILDGQGTQVGLIDVSNYRGSDAGEEIYSDGEGHIYYCTSWNGIRVYELSEEGDTYVLKEEQGVAMVVDSYIGVESGGNILISSYTDGALWQWDKEKEESEKLLRWQDCDMVNYGVNAVARIAPDKLLVSYSGSGRNGVFVLTKTPLEELPQKEIVVMASLYPDPDLWDEVMKFNELSDKYRVVVEQYGAEGYSWGDDPEAVNRLDATLVSGHPPDILDLPRPDIMKYVSQGILENLEPWLEKCGLSKEDFLETVVDAYTIDGSLVCLPTGFNVYGLWGRTSQVGNLGAWTMEDVYALTEANPEMTLVEGVNRHYLLTSFCADYYLEEFVDWENKAVSFENEEFRKLLSWIGGYPEEGEGFVGWHRMSEPVSGDILMIESMIYNFSNLLECQSVFGEEISLLGYPDADGEQNISCTFNGTWGIVANATQKEGAWNFLEYHLTRDPAEGYGAYYGADIPTRKDLLEGRADMFAEEVYRMKDINGDPVPEEGLVWRFTFTVNGEEISYTNVPMESIEALLAAVEATDFTLRSEVAQKVVQIVEEEAESYFNGDKGLDDVIQIIQSRAGVLVAE